MSSTALDSLSPSDAALFRSFGFGAKRPIDIPIVHHGFERHARAQPDAVAVEHTLFDHSLTYSQLDRLANRLARRLRALGARPGKRVCVLARRSIYFVTAVLAVLKAGAQYVPLDAVTITEETLGYVLKDADPTVVCVMRDYAGRVPGDMCSVTLEDAIDDDEDDDFSKPEDWSSPSDGAYVIYTSGTTGRPKGVDVRHIGVTNVIGGSPGNVGMRPGLRVAQLLNIAFDMGAWEILGSLYNGCTLCLRANTSKEWISLMKTVDVVIATPSVLACHDPSSYPTIKSVIVGGEVCPQAMADTWAQYTAFHNCCGPTEISICNTVQRHHTPGYPLSIGTPIPNTNVYVLSRDPSCTTPVPIGEVGCMWVGGAGVSGGYINLPELSAARWKPDPFVEEEGAMMFNTGDLGRWREDGQLDHFGRADDQVKVKGFRVELDGVAAAMRTHTPVQNAAALLVDNELWGFLTPSTLDLSAVRAATAKVQPYYATPSQYLALDAFPMTRNGKVDKRALRELAEGKKANANASANANAMAKANAAGNGNAVENGNAVGNDGGQGDRTEWLSVLNAGVPFSPSLPGTPFYLTEQPTTEWNTSALLTASANLDSISSSTSNSPTPTPSPSLTPTPTSAHAETLVPASTSIPAPTPVPALIPTSVPAPTPAATPVSPLAPAPASAVPVPVSLPSQPVYTPTILSQPPHSHPHPHAYPHPHPHLHAHPIPLPLPLSLPPAPLSQPHSNSHSHSHSHSHSQCQCDELRYSNEPDKNSTNTKTSTTNIVPDPFRMVFVDAV